MLKSLASMVLFFCFILTGWADPAATQALVKFLSSYQQASGDFSQTLVGDRGDVIQTSEGTFALSRPVSGEAAGKFRWETAKPSKQLLIADGKKIYFYDASLQQVTVQKQQEVAMRNSPAMLLSGSLEQISHAYNVKEASLPNQTVFTLQPKHTSFFHVLKIIFSSKDHALQKMTVEDNLGQRTEMAFSHIQYDVPVNTFYFTPPKGVDVVNN